jgi:phenylpyruvate tautomerase PptA (4-oxalocrotonate tautomerase family)
MPLVNISLRKGMSADYRRAIADAIHQAMMDAFRIPADDRFILICEHSPENMIQDRTFFGIERSDKSVFLQIVVNHRPVEQKASFYEFVVKNLGHAPGLRPEDIFIGIVEVAPENWWAFARNVNASGSDAVRGTALPRP